MLFQAPLTQLIHGVSSQTLVFFSFFLFSLQAGKRERKIRLNATYLGLIGRKGRRPIKKRWNSIYCASSADVAAATAASVAFLPIVSQAEQPAISSCCLETFLFFLCKTDTKGIWNFQRKNCLTEHFSRRASKRRRSEKSRSADFKALTF